MAIKGSFKEVSLPDVLQLLAVGRKTGCLKVTDGSNFGSIYFKDGKISFANLLNRPDRLGDRLFSRGLITAQQQEEALKKQKEEDGKRRLGVILLEMGLIKETDIEADVSDQIEDTIFFLLRWVEGEFFFEPEAIPENENILVSLDAMNLLLEEARRVDEWRTLEKKLPSPQTVLEKIIVDLDKQKEIDLKSEEKQVLSLVDGYRSSAEIMEASALGEFATSKIIYGLLLSGLIKRGSEKSKQAASWNLNIIDDHRNLGMAFYRTQMYDEALREYRRIIEIKPDYYEARFYLGLIHFRKKEYAESATEFLESIAIEPKKAAAYNNLGLSLEIMGEVEDAARQYRKAIELSPNLVTARINLAYLLYYKHEHEAAQEQLNKIEKANEKMPIMVYLQGLISFKKGDFDTALKSWLTLENVCKQNSAILNNIGAIMQAKEQDEEAGRYFNLALKTLPNNKNTLRNLVELYYKNNLVSQSLEILNKMGELDLLDSQDMARMGNLYLKQGQRDLAMKWWNKTIEIDPENQMVKRNLSLLDKNAFSK